MASPRLVLFGIPIYFSSSWLFVVAYMIWSLATGYFPGVYPHATPLIHWALGGSAALLLFACIILHELGHSVVAQRHRVPVAGVTLFFFGGVSQLAGQPRRPQDEIRIAAAGPLVSVLLAVGASAAANGLRLAWPGSFALALLRYVAVINIGLAIFNLLPAFPLDGGRILRAVLWAITKNMASATRVAGAIGAVFGTGLMLLGAWLMVKERSFGAGMWYVLLGWFLRNAALRSVRAGRG